MTHFFTQSPNLILVVKVGTEFKKLRFLSNVYSTDDKEEIDAIKASKQFKPPKSIYLIPKDVDPKSPDLYYEIPEITHSPFQLLVYRAGKLGNIAFPEKLSESELRNVIAKREGELRKLLVPEVVERPSAPVPEIPLEISPEKPKRKKA